MLAIQLKIVINDDITIQDGKVVEISKWGEIQNLHLKDWDFNMKKKSDSSKKKGKTKK